MKIFLDMDGVLVVQTGRENFHLMSFNEKARPLWEFVRDMDVSLLSMTPDKILDRATNEKRIWCDIHLSVHVPVIVTPDSIGKAVFTEPGSILVDDSKKHADKWERGGGIFIHWKNNPDQVIEEIRKYSDKLKVLK